MFRVSCVIVTYNIGKGVIDTYNSIKDQVDYIFFVDNGSRMETINILECICKNNEKCKLICSGKNLGIANALNKGIKVSLEYNVDFILTLDHDSKATPNMIQKMLETYEKCPDKEKIVILSPVIYDINKLGYLVEVNECDFQYIKEPIQSGSLIKTTLFEQVGFYDENLFIYYVDTELCYRAIQRGYNIIQCNNVILYHEEGKKTKHKILGKCIYYNNYNEFAVYYRARNNVIMYYKYNKIFTSKDRLLKDFIKIILCDNKKVRKIKFHFKGIFDGIKEVRRIKTLKE